MKNENETTSVTLTEDTVTYGGLLLRYRLSVGEMCADRRFFIAVRLCDEACEEDAGGRLEDALDAYRKIVKGAVTPCTLRDVLTDLQNSGKKLKKTLYNSELL